MATSYRFGPLVEAEWPGLAIEDSNRTVRIATLRRALGVVALFRSPCGPAQSIQIKLSLVGNAPMFGTWNENRRDLHQLRDDLARILQPPQMGVACGEQPEARAPGRIFLQGDLQHAG